MKRFAGVLLIQGDEYVLQHRDDRPDITEPNTLSVWGGEMERGETASQAALRELREETGLVMDESDITLITEDVFTDTGDDSRLKGEHAKVFTFVARVEPGIKVECYEGQGIARLKIKNPDYNKLSVGTLSSVRAYENKIR